MSLTKKRSIQVMAVTRPFGKINDWPTAAAAGVTCRIVDRLSPEAESRLTGFLSRGCDYSFMQHWSWPDLVGSTRIQRFRYLWCERQGEILLSGVLRFTTLFPGRYLAFFPRGPVTRRVSDLEACLQPVMSTLRQSGVCTILLNPRWEGAEAEAVRAVLAEHGFHEVERANQSMYSATGVIALDRSDDEIFAHFKSRCRRDIRASARAGLIVRRVTSEDHARRFAEMYEAFVRLKQLDVAGKPRVMDQYHHIRRHGGAMQVAELDGQLVGGITALREGARATINIIASMPLTQNISRSYPMVWETARQAKSEGCRSLDLAGLPDENDADEGDRGRLLFKMAFNPDCVRLVPLHAAMLRPFSHALLYPMRQAYLRSPLRRHVAPMLRRR